MKRTICMLSMVLGIPALQVVAAQDEESMDTYIYATYFVCDTVNEDAADEVFKRRLAPAYEKAMEQGHITGWGYLKHHTGGKWRRISYHMASSVTGVLNAGKKMQDMTNESWTDADDAFPASCRSHDDYIWRSASGSLTEERGTVGMSVYLKCDMSREERADEIVEKAFKPIYDAHTGEGKLTSWGWSTHVVGGGYRRLATMTAKDIDTLMKMRASILSADVPEGDEFVSICGSHQDYIWTIEMEGRK